MKPIAQLTSPTVPRGSATLAAEASHIDMDPRTVGQHIQDFAACSWQVARLLGRGWFGQIADLIARGFKPTLAITSISYDETPWLMRAGTDSDKKFKCVAKVFQTDARCSVALEWRRKLLLFKYRLPSTLQAVDHCTAETTAESIRQAFDMPGLAEMLSMFPHIVHHSCMDRASSNLKVEASLVDARTKKQSRLAVACTIHKAHKTQTAVHSVVPEVVSGQIGFAVAMRPGGAVATLQEVLHRFFQAHLQV